MLNLLIIVIFGIGFAYFATQNTGLISLQLGSYLWQLPLYLIALGSLLVGLFVSSILSALDSISTWSSIRGKEHKIKERDSEIQKLENRVKELELENSKLDSRREVKYKDEEKIDHTREETERKSLLGKIRSNLSLN